MDVKIVTVIVASITTLVTTSIKDMYIKKRSKAENEKSIYQRYSKPLQKSLEKLIWRLIEITKTKDLHLKYDIEGSDYSNYKYLSTIYRFMSVFAWLRLAGRELTYYKVSKEKHIIDLNNAIFQFKSSIADGRGSETERLKNILVHYKHDISILDRTQIENIGSKIDNYLLKSCSKNYSKLSNKAEIIDSVLEIINDELGLKLMNDFSSDLEKITLITECWIYRDWQDSIGDFMLVEGNNNDKAKVMSFRDFEQLYERENKDRWIKRSENLFKNFCVGNNELHDYRVIQMRKILKEAYLLLLALDEIKVDGSIIKHKTKIELKQELLNLEII